MIGVGVGYQHGVEPVDFLAQALHPEVGGVSTTSFTLSV